MIEVENNKVKCNMGMYEPEPIRSGEQEADYERVIEAVRTAHELFEAYKFKYGTDKRGINKLLSSLNGGRIL